MRYLFQSFYADPIDIDDEIDHLFNQLEPIKPPPELVDSILTAVLTRLPHLYQNEEAVSHTPSTPRF